MSLRALLAAPIATAALLAGFATPARAADPTPTWVIGGIVLPLVTPQAFCGADGGNGLPWDPYYFDEFTGYADYATVSGAPGFYQWTQFRYKLDEGLNPGTHSNVYIALTENGELKYYKASPDDRHSGVWYTVRPASPIYTRTTAVSIQFTVDFDRPNGSDPRCYARTAPR